MHCEAEASIESRHDIQITEVVTITEAIFKWSSPLHQVVAELMVFRKHNILYPTVGWGMNHITHDFCMREPYGKAKVRMEVKSKGRWSPLPTKQKLTKLQIV